jgi:hypothetical protein
MTEVMIDPNVRVAGGLTFSGFEDVRGPMPLAGQEVLVREPEANLVAIGVVDHLNDEDRLVYVRVDWTQLAPDHLPTDNEFLGDLRRRELARSVAPEPISRQVTGVAAVPSA